MTQRDEAISKGINASIENADPVWRATYEVLCKVLLTQQRYVCGDDFKTFCKARLLWEPHHHNVWAGAPTVLAQKGWIEPLVYVKPIRPHNHMPQVSFYQSNLFDEEVLWHLRKHNES